METGGDSIGFIKANGFNREYVETFHRLRSDSLKSVVRAYADNMDRVMAMPAFIVNLTSWVAVGARLAGNIPFVSGVPPIDVLAHRGTDGSLKFNQDVTAWEKAFYSKTPLEQAEFAFMVGGNLIDLYTNAREDPVGHEAVVVRGTTSIFYAMVLNSYAALEALAGDLWVQIVNLAPEKYGTEKGDIGAKQITVKDLSEFDFDSKGRMGELLKRSGRVDFQSLKGIREAYASIFSKSSKPYNAFTSDPALELTASCRHLIAHRGGRVDKKFKQETKPWPEYADMVEEQYLALNGDKVCALIDPCVKTAVDLITSLDSWAVHHEKKRN